MLLLCTRVFAGTVALDAPLPLLDIAERGELTMNQEDFSFVPWRSDANLGKVQVFQYFGATMGDSEIFKPFTDLLQTSFEPDTIHVTTVLNMDAAMWGTTGLVISELEKNKKKHPTATMVIDDEGTGVQQWDLGKAGSGLIITDAKGIVKYFTREAMSEDDITAALSLLRADQSN
jgi:YtfJ family uncharacterized protein